VRAYRDPEPFHQPASERARTDPDPFRDDPILESHWGPGDQDLAVQRFHISLGSGAPKPRAFEGDASGAPRSIDSSASRQGR
jgi:hypothetical protein